MDNRIIVALDVDHLEKAKPLIEMLLPYVRCFKIGLELMTSAGAPEAVKVVHGLGGEVFLDGKFHDIPNTIGSVSKAASDLGVKIFNVHASSGTEAMRAAVQNKGRSQLLAVTVLTAMDEPTCQHIYGMSTQEKITQFAQDASSAGVDGLVCSPKDLGFLARNPGLSNLLKITPGVRPDWAGKNDQKRVLTPREALAAGATSLVIGRPITQPPREIGGPVEAVKRILGEL